MSTIDLGKIKLVWRGPYDNSTAYTPDDVVSSGGASYICIANSTGNAVSSGSHWNLLAQGGTDISTTLTTQGDILYRDGSGLQRLAAGTSGQVLQTGGTGANPSWGTVSSDFVKLGSTNVTSNTTEIDFLSVFSTDYEFYKIFISVYPSTTGSNIQFRAITGTNTVDTSGSSYYQMGVQPRMTTSASLDTLSQYASNSHGEVYLTYPAGNSAGTGDSYGAFTTMEVARPWDSANSKWGHLKTYYRDNGNKLTLVNGAWAYRPTTAMTGFRIYGSTFDRGRVSIYGIKH